MKNILLIPLIFLNAVAFGQTNTEVQKEFAFKNKTAQEEVTIIVEPNTEFLAFRFQGEIESGELKITIRDPKDKKEGGFQLKSESKSSKSSTITSSSGGNSSSSSSSNSSSNSSSKSSEEQSYTFSSTSSEIGKTSGSMMKQIENPLSGEWKMVIQTMNVNGKASLIIGQQQK